MDEEKLGRSALRLKVELFGPRSNQIDGPGFIGIAPPDTIHVYLHCSRRKWTGSRPMEWEGSKVHWHYNVGPVVAAFDRAVASKRGSKSDDK